MEATPKVEDNIYCAEECINKLMEIKNNDRNNDQWGNIWAT